MARNSLSTLDRLNAQIEALQKKADALKDRERQSVIAKIQSAIDHYGITAAELRTAGPRAAKPAKPLAGRKAPATSGRPAMKKKGVIRFRDDAGHTWTGVGKRPNWFKDAIAGGKTAEDLAVR